MYVKIINFFLIYLIHSVKPQNNFVASERNANLAVYHDKDDGKSSLVFVFDTTGSMYNDLRQLREGAEMILNTALEESEVIADFVFVPFHDPTVGPATVTKDKSVFKSALDKVHVHGGGDCPEKSLGGIQLALNVSRPRSYVYVFTDATASDHRFVGKVLDAVQRKQSQVVFVLTGHCNDLHKPQYKVYEQIAAASSGQVFNLNKTNVHKVLDFVRNSIRGRMVNLGSVVNKAGYNITQEIPVDSTLGEVTVSVSGAKPSIKVVNPSGEELTGPPKLVTTLDLSEIMVVKVLQPEPGNWTITTGSEEDYSVKVVGLSNLTFNHGFSVERPASVAETSYRPLKGTYNYMMISLTHIDRPVKISYATILALDGTTLLEIPLREIDSAKKIYLADAFMPPDDFFYIAINGRDEYNQELKRIGATAVQAKPPDVPYLTVPRQIEARAHETVTLTCNVESLVPLTAMWTKDTLKIQQQISSLQSTSVDYVIDDMSEEHVGTYRCVAKNVAGISKAMTELTLSVDPPQVTIAPDSKTLELGDNVTITCTAISDALLLKYALIFNGTLNQYVTDIHLEPNLEGLYIYNQRINNVSERDSGLYSCVAANRGGETIQSSKITIQVLPVAQILGPHTLTKQINTTIQLVCQVESATRLVWVAPNNTIARDLQVQGHFTDMFNVENVTEDGVWSCVASRNKYNASDTIEITILMKPQVTIEGRRNVTILNGTGFEVICDVVAKPAPRIIWHKETERFLNHTITQLQPNVYRSVLTLNSSAENICGTYFCFGENSEGIHQDSITINVRRKMTLVEGFQDKTLQLYTQISLPCHIDAYPPPNIKWFHNETIIDTNNNIYLSENNNTLYILKVNFEDLGSYTCEAFNGFDKLVVKGSLNVFGLQSPLLSKEPVRRTTQKGKSTILTCRVIRSNPKPSISWQYKNNGSDVFSSLPTDVIMTANSSEVIITRVEIDHWGVYRCIAENVVGRDVYDVLLVVQYPPQVKNAHKNDPLEVKGGQKVVLSCDATGIPPPIVVWSKDDRSVRYSKNVYLTDTSDLVIEKATEYDSGVFTCNATSILGSTQKNFTLIVYAVPIITPPNIDPQLEVLEGSLVELPCNARGIPRPEIQWLQNGRAVTEGRKRVDEFGLRFVANLTDFGEYICIAKNQYGSATFNFSVYIWVAPYIEPPFDVSQNVLIGSNTSLNCDAVGFPIPTIFWEFQDTLLMENTTDLSFNDFGNVNITNASANQEGFYACIAENVAGIAKKFIYLSVNEPPKILQDNYTGPYIATDQDRELVISCKAIGKPKPFIIWMKDNRYLDLDSQYRIDTDGSLTIRTPTEDHSGQYTCLAKNIVGTANKTVSVEIYSLPTRMQADETQISTTVLERTNATIECPIRTHNADKVKWYKDAKLITTGPLIIPNITRHNSSSYACVVTNVISSTYSSVMVNVEWKPSFIGKGGDVEVVRGDDWYFDCGVDAKPPAKTKWLFNSKPLLGEDKARLKLKNIQLRNTGVYKCVVSNSQGTVAKQFTLDVLVPPFISEFDLLDVQLKEGVNATLDCIAKGSPKPTVNWTYNNTNWHLLNSSLATTNTTQQSEGLFRCDAVNRAGASHLVYRVSVAVRAMVDDIVVYREGELGGETVLKGVEITLGSRIRLSCKASGKPVPTVQWIRNGDVISLNTEDISYADLVLDKVESMHNGAYSCVAANEGGIDERRVKIEILEPPKIFLTLLQNTNTTEKETSLEVMSGQTFYLHCHPYGNPVPEVYWFKNGMPLRLFDDTMISTEYGEVIVSNAARFEQSGNYTCVARNKVGNTSVVYLVDVLVPPPTLKENSKSIATRIGKQLNLTCPVQGSPLPNVIWLKHPYTVISEELSRITLVDDNFTLIINQTEIQDSGKYSCVMTNKVGTTEIVFDVTIEKPPSIAGKEGKSVTESHVVPLRRSIVLKCETDGNPPPKITWLKDTQQLSDSVSNIQKALSNSLLAIWSAGTRDAGQYICIAENSAGTTHRRYNVVLQVPGKWSGWSQWSYCNVTCGLGYQQRSRFCQYIDDYNVTFGTNLFGRSIRIIMIELHLDKTTKSEKVVLDDSACKGQTSDRRKCHMPPCEEDETQPRWSVWSKWSVCSVTCGAGTQARTRRCKSKARCVGDNVQIRKCPDLPKCDRKSELTPSENEVYNSSEKSAESSDFIPEAIFEMHPEVVDTQYATDVEEVFVRPDPIYSKLYFEVNVTENLDKSYQGFCQPGYRENNVSETCDDVDECLIENNLCHSTQTCENTEGAYRCTCTRGFVALGIGQRCLDINECEQDLHGCEYACVNTAGGYVCACPRHLRLHADKHRCVPPSSYRKPSSYEDLESRDYLSTAIELPTRYTKNRN